MSFPHHILNFNFTYLIGWLAFSLQVQYFLVFHIYSLSIPTNIRCQRPAWTWGQTMLNRSEKKRQGQDKTRQGKARQDMRHRSTSFRVTTCAPCSTRFSLSFSSASSNPFEVSSLVCSRSSNCITGYLEGIYRGVVVVVVTICCNSFHVI